MVSINPIIGLDMTVVLTDSEKVGIIYNLCGGNVMYGEVAEWQKDRHWMSISKTDCNDKGNTQRSDEYVRGISYWEGCQVQSSVLEERRRGRQKIDLRLNETRRLRVQLLLLILLVLPIHHTIGFFFFSVIIVLFFLFFLFSSFFVYFLSFSFSFFIVLFFFFFSSLHSPPAPSSSFFSASSSSSPCLLQVSYTFRFLSTHANLIKARINSSVLR